MNAPTSAPQTTGLPDAVFMLGVGGMGMAPLAIYLAQAGVVVTGWDDGLRPEMAALLRQHGVEVRDALPEHPALVARSSAIGEAHPLFRAARERGARTLRRGELLAEVVADRKLVAVVGSHGKTTTTGFLIHVLAAAGFECGYLLGGLFRREAYPPARFASQSEWVVAEIDESDGTVEGFSPEVTVAVNFDWDHADRYATESELQAAFARLFARTSRRIIIPDSSEALGAVAPPDKTLRCRVPGGFNESNQAMALAAAREIGASAAPGHIAQFPGIHRRQDVLWESSRVTLLADYAHHPTEITALLEHARGEWPGRRIAVFQPHRYTRTRQFARAFAEALKPADQVLLLPVYAASEAPVAGGGSDAIVAASAEAWPVVEAGALPRALDQALADGEPATVLFIGAGDIDAAARAFARDWELAEAMRAEVSPASRVKLAEPLSGKTTLRVGGPARFFAEPASEGDLQGLVRFAKERGLRWFALGRGSNLIVSDRGFPGLVISLHGEAFRGFEPLGEGRIRVGAGLPLKRLCGLAAKAGLSGFEFLEGIPGSVGGALRMNAGAMGGWIFDVVESVRLMTGDGVVRELRRSDFNAGYRRCEELVDALALSAVIRSGSSGEAPAIRARMNDYAGRRKESQPREPSAGCIFKNPPGGHAGKMIDELGLKGLRVGGAEVSGVHGNFIINTGGASAADVLELIRQIRARTREARATALEPEALLVGERWEDVL